MVDPKENYLIVGLRGLVLVDVTEILKEAFPGLGALTAQSTLDAVELVANLGSVRFAFLNVDPDEFVKTDLAARLSVLRTHIVLMGDAAETKTAQSPFDVLARPFAEDDVLRILTKTSEACA